MSRLIEPQGYLSFSALQAHARVVITDSGGVQEETTYLQVPCLTLRANTERPVTISDGTNTLIGENPRDLIPAVASILAGWKPSGRRPALWDGQAGEGSRGFVCRGVRPGLRHALSRAAETDAPIRVARSRARSRYGDQPFLR